MESLYTSQFKKKCTYVTDLYSRITYVYADIAFYLFIYLFICFL